MLPYLFVLLAIAVRFLPFAGSVNILPHAWHFTPLAASLLFFGARGSRKQMWIPVALLVATDVVLTRFIYAYVLSWDHLVTFAWYAAILWLGTNLREKSGPVRVIGAALASSVSFFLISNFAVWAAWQMYPQDFRRIDDVLRRWPSVLPRHTRERSVLLNRDVRNARVLNCTFPPDEPKRRGSHRCVEFRPSKSDGLSRTAAFGCPSASEAGACSQLVTPATFAYQQPTQHSDGNHSQKPSQMLPHQGSYYFHDLRPEPKSQ